MFWDLHVLYIFKAADGRRKAKVAIFRRSPRLQIVFANNGNDNDLANDQEKTMLIDTSASRRVKTWFARFHD